MPDPIYGLDIETDTSISPTSGLDPNQGGITSVALVAEEGTLVLDAADLGEAELLRQLDLALWRLPAGVVATWNGAVFDLPFIATRARMLGVRISLGLRADPSIPVKYEPLPGHSGGYLAEWGMHAHCDVQFVYRELASRRGIKWSLKPVARSLGLDPVEVDRERMHLLSADELTRYVASDGHVTRELAVIADALGVLRRDAWDEQS